jgi:hypothetical protein
MPPPVRVLADRYRLIELLGEGAHGEVWTAEDTVLRELVALKWMRRGGGERLSRFQREITTLRMLRIPGVVRLFDDGIEDGRPFLVMDRASGRPFPGNAEQCSGSPLRFPWAAIAGTTLALLEVVSRVHAAGVVHRDLKPDNILVDEGGRPTVLDFGISLWHDPDEHRHAQRRAMAGTPCYLAREQILGDVVDARADLYAVGVILYEALTGQLPHEAPDVRSLLSARLSQPARPVRELVADLPATVGQVIDRLLARHANDRFHSAKEVLAALHGDASVAVILGGAAPGAIVRALLSLPIGAKPEDVPAKGPLDEPTLRLMFSGPDRLFHVREDAARLLWERTAGMPSQIEDEVTRWMRLGLARWDGALLVVDRDALGRLRACLPASHDLGEEERLVHLLAAERIREAADEAVMLSRRRAREGELGGATAALSEVLRAVRRRCPQGGEWTAEAEERILVEWAKVALAEATPYALDLARYELSRVRDRSPFIKRLETLLRSTLAAYGAGSLDALESMDEIPPFDDSELERRRHWARVAAAAGRSVPALLEDVLEDIAAWAARSGDPLSLLSLAEGRARLCYGQGRFEEAAALHMEAAEREPWLIGRIAAKLNAASALLEAFRHREAAACAAEARELSARCRHAYREGRAEWLMRAAAYRMGEALAPDLELLDAVTRLGVPDLEALECLTEAAVAFRAGSLAMAAELSGRAVQVWKLLNRPGAPLLARGLSIACGVPAEVGEVEELSTKAAACRIPGIGLQVIGLLGRAFPEARPRWQEAVPSLAVRIPREHWGERMDVLSVEESLEGASGGG